MSEATTPATPEVNELTNETPAEQQAQLQIGDIEAAVKVIDYASEQGAFRGWNVVQEVLVLRNRLVHFVRSVTPPQPEEVNIDGVTTPTTEASTDASGVPEAPGAAA